MKTKGTITRQSKEWLPCKLTQPELLAAGKKLADAMRRVAEAEARLETFKKQVQAEITAAEGEGNIARELVASEREYRNVDVEIRFDFSEGRKTIVRTDSGEVVREAAITDEERQLELAEAK